MYSRTIAILMQHSIPWWCWAFHGILHETSQLPDFGLAFFGLAPSMPHRPCCATSLCESHMATTGDPQSIPLSCPSCLANRLLRLLQFLCLLILRPEQVGPLADWVVLVVSLTMLETQSSGSNITHMPSSKLYHFLTLPLLECHSTSRSPCTGAVH